MTSQHRAASHGQYVTSRYRAGDLVHGGFEQGKKAHGYFRGEGACENPARRFGPVPGKQPNAHAVSANLNRRLGIDFKAHRGSPNPKINGRTAILYRKSVLEATAPARADSVANSRHESFTKDTRLPIGQPQGNCFQHVILHSYPKSASLLSYGTVHGPVDPMGSVRHSFAFAQSLEDFSRSASFMGQQAGIHDHCGRAH
jgi:hypothetical protein